MLRLTIEGSTVQELHDQVEQMYIHMVSDKENNCECCDHPDCPKNEILHDLPDIVKAAFARPTVEPKKEPAPEPEALEEAPEEPYSPTLEEVRAVLIELRKKKGSPAVKDILTAHGADKITDLDKTHYTAVMKEAKANAAE